MGVKGKKLIILVTISILYITSISFPNQAGIVIQGKEVKISVKRAKEIVISHSRLSEKTVKIIKLVLKKEKKRYFYEIKFLTESKKYSYSVDANTGQIINHSQENRKPEKDKVNIFDILRIPFN